MLDKSANTPADVDRNIYIIVKRNKITLAVDKEEIAKFGNEIYEIYTNTTYISSETVNEPEVDTFAGYTDKLTINFTPGSASYKVGETETASTVSYNCLYGASSSNINKEGKIVGNSFKIDSLKNKDNKK